LFNGSQLFLLLVTVFLTSIFSAILLFARWKQLEAENKLRRTIV